MRRVLQLKPILPPFRGPAGAAVSFWGGGSQGLGKPSETLYNSMGRAFPNPSRNPLIRLGMLHSVGSAKPFSRLEMIHKNQRFTGSIILACPHGWPDVSPQVSGRCAGGDSPSFMHAVFGGERPSSRVSRRARLDASERRDVALSFYPALSSFRRLVWPSRAG